MVTMIPGNYRNEYWGKSSDTKPTDGVPNASQFAEIDTGKIFVFEADGKQWYEWYAQADAADNGGGEP